MNDIPKSVGMRIIEDLEGTAQEILRLDPAAIQERLVARKAYGGPMDEEIDLQREKISSMLELLAKACREFYSREEWMCILGV